jgi:transcriptional regulator with XRE-family HTH domain
VPPVKRPTRQRRKTYFREWREFSTDFSQAEVARRLDRDHSSVQRLEAGLIPYNADWLEELANLYRCDPWDLISRHPESARGPRSDVMSAFYASPPDVQRQVMDAARAIMRTRRTTK